MFEGTHTAIVTPFTASGAVDYDRLRALVEFQIAGGVEGIVPVGTTGESPSLNYDEHHKVVETVIETTNKRALVIAGTGGNSTSEAVELTQHAKDAGADATLQVTPYYNKPNDKGLLQHFHTIADIGLPVVLYNIPGRTSRVLSLDLVVELAKHPSIAAMKEASGDVDRVSQYHRRCDLEVVSGDDGLTLPKMIVGAVGSISVASNIVPDRVSNMVRAGLAGNWGEAHKMHNDLHRLFTDLFVETNPIPVKTALAMMGKMEESFRLPMAGLSDENKNVLRETLVAYGLV